MVDIGGGAGYFTAEFRARGADCYLFEPDPAELFGERRAPEGAVLADGYWLPVRDGGADICFSSNVLEHVADPIGLIGEMIRVTRPGGLIYLSFTNWYSPWGGHEMSPWHYLGPRFAERHYRRRHGREPKHRVGSTLYPPPHRAHAPARPVPARGGDHRRPARATTRAGAGPWSGSPGCGRC